MKNNYQKLIFACILMSFLGLHAQTDFAISYIKRLPEIDYVWDSANPAVEGWPEVGQEVTWRAHVKNWSDTPQSNISYEWVLDGEVVEGGTLDFGSDETVTAEFPWLWTFDRHEIIFRIDTDNAVEEQEELNNELLIYTDALSIGFYVEQSLYDYFRLHQHELGVHTNCWEDWVQHLHVDRWNQMLADAVFPETPQGVLDRLRIDEIHIVPDGALPLNGGAPTNNPDLNDFTVDLQWGFPSTLLDSGFYSNTWLPADNNPFYYEGSLLHELGHARYLGDNYAFDVSDNTAVGDPTIMIYEGDVLVPGSEFMPFIVFEIVHYNEPQGLMGGVYTEIGKYDAMALNLIAGHRPVCGNMNAPCNISTYQNDLPQTNILTVVDPCGEPLPNVSMKFYRAEPKPDVWYGKLYDDIADIEMTTDGDGQIVLGQCPFTEDGTIEMDYGVANGVLIVRMQLGEYVRYSFLESTQFNIEYWKGNTESAQYTMEMSVDCNLDSETWTFDSLKVFPVPAAGTVKFLAANDLHAELILMDATGRTLKTHTFEGQEFNLQRGNLPAGVYYYRIVDSSKGSISGKIIFQ